MRPLKRPRLGGAVYVLPNLITTGNLFFGFFSIVKSLKGDYHWAASAILIAAIFDVLDGRIARLTKGTSEFGVQYDSLCDLVSFGLAPAFLMYQMGLNEFGRLGWIACFLFLACGALRLARFNVQSSIGKASGDFTGLPIPMAAAVVACFAAFASDLDASQGGELWIQQSIHSVLAMPNVRHGIMLALTPMLALAMVSNITYRSHKTLKVSGVKPFRMLVIFVMVTGAIAYQPELFGCALSLLYFLSGPIEWMFGWKKAVEDDEIFAEDEESLMEQPDPTESPEPDDESNDSTSSRSKSTGNPNRLI